MEANPTKLFRKNVRRILEEKGWDDVFLAGRLKMSAAQLSIILSQGNPSTKMIGRFCKALEVHPVELFLDAEGIHIKESRAIGDTFLSEVDAGADPIRTSETLLKVFSNLRRKR